MATPTYGPSLFLPILKFENAGMTGMLAAAGNSAQSVRGAVRTDTYDHSPPGAGWTVRRTTGVQPRRFIWDVVLVATSAGNLDNIEWYINKYMMEGRGWPLVVWGTTYQYATMVPGETRPEGPRTALAGGGVRQRWQIVFDVLWPADVPAP